MGAWALSGGGPTEALARNLYQGNINAISNSKDASYLY
jgi:hypothetical protein